MAIEYKKYLEDENGIKHEHVYYSSSNIEYSHLIDVENSIEKILEIVFKKGAKYRYEGVDLYDYMAFRNAIDGSDLTNKSNGQAFHKYIKKYKAVRLEDVDLKTLEEQKQRFIEMDKQEKLITEER